MKIRRIDRIGIIVDDLSAAKEFFCMRSLDLEWLKCNTKQFLEFLPTFRRQF